MAAYISGPAWSAYFRHCTHPQRRQILAAKTLRQCEPVPHVALTRAESGRVDGEHDRLGASSFGALHQVGSDAAVLIYIELKPARASRLGEGGFHRRV